MTRKGSCTVFPVGPPNTRQGRAGLSSGSTFSLHYSKNHYPVKDFGYDIIDLDSMVGLDLARTAMGPGQVFNGRQSRGDAGLGRESLYRTLSTNGKPTFAMALKVVEALGLRFQAMRRRA